MLGGQADLDVLAFEGWPGAADNFTGPQLLAEDDERAIFKIADGAEEIFRECSVVSVNAAAGEFAFECGIAFGERATGTGAKSFALKTVDERFKDSEFGRGDDDRVFGGFAVGDLMALAIIAQTIEMAEKIEPPVFGGGDSQENARPNLRSVGAADGFAIFVGFR